MMLLQLYFEFFKTGLFAIGGGMATLPFLSDMADRLHWFTQSQLADMVAISESTPGPIGINMATYVGFITAGLPGSILATLGLITPSIIVILIIAAFLKAFQDRWYVKAVFYGLRAASTGLITAAGLSIAAISLLNQGQYAATGSIVDLFFWKGILLAILVFVATRYIPKIKDLHPICFILFSAVVGILFHFAGV